MSMEKVLNVLATEIGQSKVNQALASVNLETAKEENEKLSKQIEERDSVITGLREEVLRLQEAPAGESAPGVEKPVPGSVVEGGSGDMDTPGD